MSIQTQLSFESLVLRVLCVLGRHQYTDQHHVNILGGPLRGKRLSMPALERASYILGRYEPHVANLICEHAKEGAVVYDVGANVGYLSMLTATCVGPTGRVFAFEPDPKNVRALKSNIQNNRLGNINCVQSAVSDREGQLEFATYGYSLVGHIAHEGMPDDAQVITVPTVRLDDFVFIEKNPAPSLIKIDVEGGEVGVLYGARKVLTQFKPVVIAEIRGGATWEMITQLMDECGYTYKIIDEGGWDMESDNLADVLFYPKPAIIA